ncbi:hypothetical protein BsBEST3102_40170 [Bacillus subtilis]|nr:hypothetical protein BsBEST3096_40270 [Bacillus subtilis]BDB95233.1 hypothetical protein BSG8_39850 [Bacillus subtilis subsp. natto]BCV81457.1 hypothetical protein BsBEST3102_40170 [Bacillus subtilis]BCV85689.1 hypothetical protein BsBEST3106_40170 [Bacillus subtilis]BCV89922.1 hypothetical protein BsBEST3109_40180 [Bacillus subtilis]
MSRFCLEYADSTLFHLSDFFTQFPLRITEYNWVIGDILNMMDVSEDKDHWNDIIGTISLASVKTIFLSQVRNFIVY